MALSNSLSDVSSRLAPTKEPSKRLKDTPAGLLDLPDEILYTIIKEYVPVTDKATLRHMEPFKRFLAASGIWYPSTYRLFQLASITRPGWYVDMNRLDERYHVSVDYTRLTFMVHTFCTAYVSSSICIDMKQQDTAFSEIPDLLAIPSTFTLVGERDVLFYQYQSRVTFKFIFIWILTLRKTLRWSEDDLEHAMENDRCLLTTETDTLLLTVSEDATTILLECQTHRHPVDSACSCPEDEEWSLLPYNFLICHDTHPTENIQWFSPQQDMFHCGLCENRPQEIHALHRIVCRNVHRDDASAVKKYFLRHNKSFLQSKNWLKCPNRNRLIFQDHFEI